MNKQGYQAQKSAERILKESDKSIGEIVKKLKSKEIRKAMKNMPKYPEVRLVDIEDPFVAMSWSQHMEELEERDYERYRYRRPE